MRISHLHRASLTALALGTVVTLAACSSGGGAGAAPSANPTISTSTSSPSSATEVGTRVAFAYPGGIRVLDGTTLATVADLDTEEFTRLNAAGDGRHVMVTTSAGFQVLDTGAGTAGDAELTDRVFKADTPGHVVQHAGKTVLYADGTSNSTIFDPTELTTADGLPEYETVKGVKAHHGVSVMLEDGTFLTSVGNADGANGISVRDASGALIAESKECPGLHGEGTAKNEVVVFGCQDGALMYSGGDITKLKAPDQPFGAMGDAWTSETSPIVVGDYNNDVDAEGYLVGAVTLVDTASKTLKVVDLPEGAEYTFRGVARGPDDLAYIIGTDGSIHVLDPETGKVTTSFPVIKAWKGPADWQDPQPTIEVIKDIAYVTEPAAKTMHAVNLITGEVVATTMFDVTPNEIAAAAG